MWGWTEAKLISQIGGIIIPTYVGVDRKFTDEMHTMQNYPHVCGGGPGIDLLNVEIKELSPRMWGWTSLERCENALIYNYPHVCGGGP